MSVKIPSLLCRGVSSQDISDLYNDESKWENGKLKNEEALPIAKLDLEIYEKSINKELNELSQENIFKKIDTFFLINEEQRKTMDDNMTTIRTNLIVHGIAPAKE